MAHPFIGNALRSGLIAAALAIEPPPPPDYVAWAQENITFGEESPFKGPYNPDLFPFFTPILQALQPDDPSSIVTLKKSAQLGGTVLGSIFLGATMCLDPCPMMNTHPTVENAKAYKQNKWAPFVRGAPTLRRVMANSANNDPGDTTKQQNRKDDRGFIMWNGANSAASLSQHSVKKQHQDDLSKWVADNDQGDPEQQAQTRSFAYSGKGQKIFKTSTPTLDEACRISKRFEEGTQEYWEVPCPHCDEYQALTPEDFIENIDRDHPERSHFLCKHCGCEIHQHHRYEFNLRGRFRPKNPLARSRSFFLWSAYSPLATWEEIAVRYLQAEGEAEQERAVYNDVFGMAYVAKSETPPWETIRDRARLSHYNRGVIPVGGLLLTIGVDVQIDRLELQIVAWGSKRRRWVVDYHVVQGTLGQEDTRRELSAYLSRTWPDMFGNKRRADLMAIDSGNWTDEVYDYVLSQPDSRVIAVKGASQDGSPPHRAGNFNVPDSRGKTRKTKRKLWLAGVSTLKHSFYQNVKGEDPDARGYVGFPADLEDHYFIMLTNERKTLTRNKRLGFAKWEWIKVGDNEAIDNMNYAEVAARRLNWDRLSEEQWDALAAQREREPEDRQEDLFDPARTVAEEVKAGQAKITEKDKSDESRAARIARSLA